MDKKNTHDHFIRKIDSGVKTSVKYEGKTAHTVKWNSGL